MPHGSYRGVKRPVVHGPKHNSALFGGVTADGTSGKLVPATSVEWASVLATAGLATSGPISLWQMQEGAGSLADTIGSITLAPNNAPSYGQAMAGWSRLGVKMTDGTGNQRFSSTSTSLPDVSTTSGLLLLYVGFTSAVGAVRGISSLGVSATWAEARHNAVAPRFLSGANTANGASTLSTQVRPWVTRVNVTTSNCTLYTDQEKVTPTYGTMTGKSMQIGATAAAPANAVYLYGVLFTGANAELSDAQVKSLLVALGWTIPWS